MIQSHDMPPRTQPPRLLEQVRAAPNTIVSPQKTPMCSGAGGSSCFMTNVIRRPWVLSRCNSSASLAIDGVIMQLALTLDVVRCVAAHPCAGRVASHHGIALAVIAVTGLRLYDEELSISDIIAALLLPLS